MKSIKRAVIVAISFATLLLTGCPEPEPAHTHDWGDWTVTKAATCTAVGEETRVCTLDAIHKETRPIAALGHNYAWATTTAPTCTEAGSETGTCTHDGTKITRVIPIDPKAHDWGEWSEPTPATATITTDSIKTRICKHDNSHIDTLIVEYATGTAGLAFELINNNTAYRVRKGTVESGVVHIPGYYRPNADSQYLSVTEIGASDDGYDNSAFSAESGKPSNITAVHISAGVTSIGRHAFSGCTNLISITIPEGITFFGENAFQYCWSLTSITLPASLTTISDYAFYSCSELTSITIPASVTSIGMRAFMTCSSLTSITVDKGNANYSSEDGILYNNEKTTLIQAPGGISGNVTIPKGVTTIGREAFFWCKNLTGITIPTSVTSIEFEAFRESPNLTSITIPASVTSIYQAFAWWSPSQTINIEGHASEAAADAAWGINWRNYCDATINYLGH